MIVHNVKVVVRGGCMEKKQWKGMGLAILGALFWGLSGTSVQFLENAKHINVEWLLEARLLIAGILSIGLAYIRDGSVTGEAHGRLLFPLIPLYIMDYLIFSRILVRYFFIPSASLFSIISRRFFNSVRILATCPGVRGLNRIS